MRAILRDIDEDDDDLVLFKEQSQQALPCSMMSQQEPTQDSMHDDDHESRIMSKTVILSRRERRKRRHEWRERQLLEEEDDENSPPEVLSSEGAFASLQHLFDSSQQSNSQQSQPNSISVVCMVPTEDQDDKDPDKKEKESVTLEMINKSSGEGQQILPSPAVDFVTTEGIPNQIITVNRCNTHEGTNTKEDEEPNLFQNDSEDEQDTPSLSQSPPSQPRLQELQWNRKKRRRRDQISKIRKKASHSQPPSFLSQNSVLKPWSRNRTESSASVTHLQNIKRSIVGSRPSRWNRECNNGIASSTSLLSSQRRKRFMTQSRSKKQFLTPLKPLIVSGTNIGSKVIRVGQQLIPRRMQTRSKSPEVNMQSPTTNLSFAPSFIPSVLKKLQKDDQVEDPSQDQESESCVSNLPRHHLGVSPPPPIRRGRTKTPTGTWARKLQLLQSLRATDVLRLQNPVFRQHSVNDPRQRAETITQITLLGSLSSTSASVLAYVHYHSSTQQDQTFQPFQQKLAWVTFAIMATPRSTFHSQLQKFQQLRIYNAILVPCPPFNCEDLCLDNLISNTCENVLIATWLWEVVPCTS